jgi:drug/metabolite transporter (DMT)-like permease
MSIDVTIAVLCAALFHAMWNGLVKAGKDPLCESMLISIVWLVICASILPFLPLPTIESIPFILCSALLQVSYFLLLSKSYQAGDFGTVYPIVRGLPPLFVVLASIFIINEPISTYGIIGVVLIGLGILSLALGNKVRSPKLLGFAFATAFIIATYTIVDSIGARVSGNSTSFLAWFFIIQGPIFIGISFFLRGTKNCLSYVSGNWKKGAFSGILSFAAYAIVLWAVTKAPIAYVSALRETSVLFASLIAILFLNEPLKVSRFIASLLIFLGIYVMRLS